MEWTSEELDFIVNNNELLNKLRYSLNNDHISANYILNYGWGKNSMSFTYIINLIGDDIYDWHSVTSEERYLIAQYANAVLDTDWMFCEIEMKHCYVGESKDISPITEFHDIFTKIYMVDINPKLAFYGLDTRTEYWI